ncbi:MAG: hypothetical protein C0469_03755 [Cyanobacteria bacterium DS2.3.42]|nr:hypothetical protein [Cyanobacteria bacterium DS2.3.42]
MSEAEGASAATCATFLEMLKTLPWCKQGTDVLVAVHKITPEIIEVIKDLGANVYPGGIHVKLNKSFLHDLQNKFDDGQPLPAVLVWKAQHVEIWYRRQNANEFPYDTWQNPQGAPQERECVLIPLETLGDGAANFQSEIAGKAKECPAMIPPQ